MGTEAERSADLPLAIWRINGILFVCSFAPAPWLLLPSTLEDRSKQAVNGPTSVGSCLLGLLFCILTPLHRLFSFLLHPGNTNLQFLLLAEETRALRKSGILIRQVEISGANASWCVQDMQCEGLWPGGCFPLVSHTHEAILPGPGDNVRLECKGFHPLEAQYWRDDSLSQKGEMDPDNLQAPNMCLVFSWLRDVFFCLLLFDGEEASVLEQKSV